MSGSLRNIQFYNAEDRNLLPVRKKVSQKWYPRNAVAILTNRITIPTDHVCIGLYDPQKMLRPVEEY
jgi:hypothetical protein